MTVLSDRAIERLCLEPQYVHKFHPSLKYVRQDDELVNVEHGGPMSPTRDYESRYLKNIVERPYDCQHRPISEEELAKWKPMIAPFVDHQVRVDEADRKILSYGLSSAGYDVRLAEDFRIFSNVNSEVSDPKRLNERCLVQGEIRIDDDGSKYVILPPNSYLLGHTPEVFHIPNDVMVIAVGKSTYARAGAIVNVTPIEPGFSGTVVIEISNATPLPLRIYANEGCAQFVFYRMTDPCRTSYADRGGKYQGQQGIVLSKV